MPPQRAVLRFWIGFASVLAVLLVGFVWIAAKIPFWGADPAEISRTLPADERVPDPDLVWMHAITIQAAPEAIYPWLAQIGDSRGGFYSYTFIENLFMRAAGMTERYTNTAKIHNEWQEPAPGQGVILDVMAIQETGPGRYVLVASTEKMAGVLWTWLWYLDPVDADTTRLIVRHRFQYPPDVPPAIMTTVMNMGYVMERGMMLGIRERAEGRIPSAYSEVLDIALWLSVLVTGIAAALRFVRHPGRWHPLGVGLEAVIVLLIFTFIQPPVWLRILLLLVLVGSIGIAYQPGKLSARVRSMFAKPLPEQS